MVSLLQYAIFKYSDYSGVIVGVDWFGVDVVLRREGIEPIPQEFRDFRIAVNGYIAVVNEKIAKG